MVCLLPYWMISEAFIDLICGSIFWYSWRSVFTYFAFCVTDL